MARTTNKLVFYHIPKTGGTWVAKAIQAWNVASKVTEHGQHSTWNQEKNSISNKEGFTAVRCPLHWYKSAFRFVYKNHSLPPPGDMMGRFNTLSLYHFVRDVLECWNMNLWRYYWHYLEGCKHVIHTERLEMELYDLFEKVGETFEYRPVPKANVSVSSIQAEWNIRQAQLVFERDKRVFEELGYEECFVSSECVHHCKKQERGKDNVDHSSQ